MGMCTRCGKVVYEGEEGRTSPAIVCSECLNKEKQEIAAKQERDKREAESKLKTAKYMALRSRNKGLIAAGIITAVWIILGIISVIVNPENIGGVLGGIAITSVFIYTFSSQCFWDGIVRQICLTGGAIIGTPGVIFSFDLDGVIFLIGIKVLFALLRILVFLLTSAFLILVAVIISPFTFIPKILKLNREIKKGVKI